MQKYEYLLFNINPDSKVVSIENIAKKIPDSFQLKKGIKIGDSYPSKVILNIFPDSGDMLTDFIDNISSCVIINSIVKDVFEKEGLDTNKVEYLPFVLLDKKNKTVKTQYFIANCLICINCFDFEKSKCTKSSRNGSLLDVETVVLHENKIPNDAKFFRIGEYPSQIVIRSDLLDVLKEKEFTGISVISQGQSLI